MLTTTTTTASSDLSNQKFLHMKEDDNKFISRLISKETSMANPSFRVYYGGVTVAVPFMWESQPGTPKYSFSETTLPPLTPPPSYYTKSTKKPIKKKHSRSGSLLHFLLSSINPKKTSSTSSSSSPSSAISPTPSSASSRSSWNSTPSCRKCHERSRSRFSSSGSSFDSRALFDDQEFGSPTSTLCFGVGRGGNPRR